MGGLSPELLEQLPSSCRKCPVIKRFDTIVAIIQDEGQKETESAIRILDSVDRSPEVFKIRNSQIEIGKMQGELAVESAKRQLVFERAAERVISTVAEGNCPGSTRGVEKDSRVVRVLEWITGARSCHNPDLQQFASDEITGIQLDIGNWVATEHEGQE